MQSEGDVQAPGEYPDGGKGHTLARAGLNVASVIPGIGSFLAAMAGVWSEHEQEQANNFFKYCIKMLQEEMAEKAQTILEVMARVDMQDEEIAGRVRSEEFHSLVRKALRDWAGSDSEEKRRYVRNVLANAAVTKIADDDVVRVFIEWIKRYSELHFKVIRAIYNSGGVSRSEVWAEIGKGAVREDSADADMFKLLFHELTTGYLIRQQREVASDGRFITQSTRGQRRATVNPGVRYMKSAFDDGKSYVLTELGEQFVHYAMEDVPVKIEFKPTKEGEREAAQA